ncbi:sigma factor-like helix-turn-helix DNA-binding protein [Streptomyces sp. WMMB 714]|uniref:sigma factor-like helix-turn-helix DNA-binding protein n=1 Tax=Streptomyces sp. WMMB 714 TaxID=1286822 RepID=UPI0020C78DF2|nr:sigma factor-like helix-turn-helix DNA-binding protein [Streptomyces sp. WMMB 714]
MPDVRGCAADVFDRLHDRHAPSLTRQVFLLCGRPSLARRSVGHAFRLAWQRWPEVAVDPDPAGWVRAAAYRYALAPWRNFRLSGPLRHARAMRNVPPGDRGLFDALLRLPPSYRAVVLLCDGLGLDPADAAAEVEASSAAAAGRLRRGRAALAERVPELRDAADGQLPALTAALLGQLAAPQPVTLPPAPRVRRLGALRSWGATAAALGLTASLAAAGFTLVASDDERNVPRLPVPKKPSATLAPDRQPGRLLPVI